MGREPVVIGALVRVILVAAAGWIGIEFSEAETEQVIAVVGAVYGLIEIFITAYQRSKVTPVANPNIPGAVVVQDVPPARRPRVDPNLPEGGIKNG